MCQILVLYIRVYNRRCNTTFSWNVIKNSFLFLDLNLFFDFFVSFVVFIIFFLYIMRLQELGPKLRLGELNKIL
jgi:hypothetical protein